MAKKNFSGGLNSLLGETQEPKTITEVAKEIEETAPIKEKNSTKALLNEDETRATFIVNVELLEKVKALAYWERVLIKDVIHAALVNHIAEAEKTKVIKPLPVSKK